MKELWQRFQDNSLSKNDFINYIVDLFLDKDYKNLKDILIIINSSKSGLHIQELINYEHEKVSFSERTATREIRILYTLGMITLFEKIGPVKRYIITSLGKDVLLSLKNKTKGGFN